MRIIECDVNEVVGRRPYGRLYEFVKAFDDSGLDCVRVENYHHKTAECCAYCLRRVIKSHKLKALDVIVRKNEVFMFRKNKIKFLNDCKD